MERLLLVAKQLVLNALKDRLERAGLALHAPLVNSKIALDKPLALRVLLALLQVNQGPSNASHVLLALSLHQACPVALCVKQGRTLHPRDPPNAHHVTEGLLQLKVHLPVIFVLLEASTLLKDLQLVPNVVLGSIPIQVGLHACPVPQAR